MEDSVRKGLGKAEYVETLDAGGGGVEPVKDCPFASIAFVLQLLLESDFDGSGLWLRHDFLLLHFEPGDPLRKNLRRLKHRLHLRCRNRPLTLGAAGHFSS